MNAIDRSQFAYYAEQLSQHLKKIPLNQDSRDTEPLKDGAPFTTGKIKNPMPRKNNQPPVSRNPNPIL